MGELKQRIVGVSETLISTKADEKLITYSLGSCIGLSLYDPVVKVGGLLHAMMPLSLAMPEKAAERPEMFIDSAVGYLLGELFKRGATRKHIVANVAGASTHLDKEGVFRIGDRNYMVLRKMLWKNDIMIAAEDIGGTDSRTMFLDMSTGKTFLKKNGSTKELL